MKTFLKIQRNEFYALHTFENSEEWKFFRMPT